MDKKEQIDLNDADKNVMAIAGQLRDYLRKRQDAADTFEGLVRWWLYRQRLLDAEETVTQAIAYLLKQGLIEKRELSDGNILYIVK